MRTESFSSLQSFQQCQRKYYFRYISKVKRVADSEAIRKGRDVHEKVAIRKRGEKEVDYALERCLSGDRQRSKVKFKRFNTHANIKIDSKKGRYIDFHEWGFSFNERLELSDFEDSSGIFRGIIDYYYVTLPEVITPESPLFKEVYIYDWKTGKPRFDRGQLNLYALALSSLYSGAEIKNHVVNTTEEIEKSWEFTPAVRKKTLLKLADLLERVDNERDFKPSPSPLCGWCDYSDICSESAGKKDDSRAKILGKKMPEFLT